jgi:hypothetical protein
MKITKDDLQRRFDEYNQLYFDGKLKSAKMGFLSKSFKTLVGIFEFKIDNNRRVKDSSIKVSKRIDWDEEKLRRVLLHEMAHFSVTQKYKKDKKHGIAFIKECKRIESQYNVKVWHSWMRKGYIDKPKSIFSFPFILCYNIASIVKFRIIQRII